MGQMFYEEQPCRCGTLSQPMCLWHVTSGIVAIRNFNKNNNILAFASA
jgi:hypothetical protein